MRRPNNNARNLPCSQKSAECVLSHIWARHKQTPLTHEHQCKVSHSGSGELAGTPSCGQSVGSQWQAEISEMHSQIVVLVLERQDWLSPCKAALRQQEAPIPDKPCQCSGSCQRNSQEMIPWKELENKPAGDAGSSGPSLVDVAAQIADP